MKNVQTINYEAVADCFPKCSNVKSRLIYGDPRKTYNPWLTVVVPTYRRTHLLVHALESILSQRCTDFLWDVLVVDNEPDDGKENDTERLIRKIDSDRIIYYRNSENIWVGDNFNRCIKLARGEWVSFLHDDDMLMPNALRTLGNLIRAYDLTDEPLGAIAASYIQVRYDPRRDEIQDDVFAHIGYWEKLPISYEMYKLTHNNVKMLAHVGGAAPTNGSTFRRSAMLEIGGFNESYGISGDLIIFYKLAAKYAVYQTLRPLGFYRWGVNSMMQGDSLRKVIHDNYMFREYVFQKNFFNRVFGELFRSCLYQRFSTFAIDEHVKISGESISLRDFDDIYSRRPNGIWYFFYKCMGKVYSMHKNRQTKRNSKKAEARMLTY